MAKNPPTPTMVVDIASPEQAFARSRHGQALLQVLASGSASYQSIANYLLRHHVRVTALGIEDLAEACQVSTATISRFARDQGFANYSAMRNDMAETLQTVFQPVEKLRNTIEQKSGDSSPGAASFDYSRANIEAARQELAPGLLDQVVARIVKARTVYVMGFGLSAHLAGMLTLHLQPFCNHVIEVVAYGGTEVAAGHLAHVGDKDVLILISFPRYAHDAIKLGHFARDHQACIVSITDSPASPLAALGDFVLLAPCTHPILPSSNSAAMAVIEALVSSLMTSNKKNVEKAIKLTEALSAYLLDADVLPKLRESGHAKPKKAP
jgi:DNA-binding MurR/RpiR family transcriptional regulator